MMDKEEMTMKQEAGKVGLEAKGQSSQIHQMLLSGTKRWPVWLVRLEAGRILKSTVSMEW